MPCMAVFRSIERSRSCGAALMSPLPFYDSHVPTTWLWDENLARASCSWNKHCNCTVRWSVMNVRIFIRIRLLTEVDCNLFLFYSDRGGEVEFWRYRACTIRRRASVDYKSMLPNWVEIHRFHVFDWQAAVITVQKWLPPLPIPWQAANLERFGGRSNKTVTFERWSWHPQTVWLSHMKTMLREVYNLTSSKKFVPVTACMRISLPNSRTVHSSNDKGCLCKAPSPVVVYSTGQMVQIWPGK